MTSVERSIAATWIAEDVPWYSVDQREQGPQTDEDAGMSARDELGRFATEREARVQVAAHLMRISEYNFVVRSGEQSLFVAAAEAIRAGVAGIRIHGRYHTVRKTES